MVPVTQIQSPRPPRPKAKIVLLVVAGSLILILAMILLYPWLGFSLVEAAGNGDTAQVRFLLSVGVDPNTPDEVQTPLSAAVHSGNVPMVQLLLKHGADIDQPQAPGANPIVFDADSPQMLKLVIAQGADVNVIDDLGLTPLMIHAENTEPEMVQILLSSGAHVNDSDIKGQTALMHLASGENADDDPVKIAQTYHLLLKAGADRSHKDMDGKTAFQVAIENDNPAAIKFLANPK